MTSKIDHASSLARRALDLIDIPSVSRDESAVLGLLRTDLSANSTISYDRDAALVARVRHPSSVNQSLARGRPKPLLVLAGHVDTVPIEGNVPGRLDDGMIHGRGASDMKGAIAVILELVAGLASGAIKSCYEVAVVLFGREEISIVESALQPCLRSSPDLHSAALTVVMEPTGNAVELGCLGSINALVRFAGRSAHVARSWHGDNAVLRATNGLSKLGLPRYADVDLGGLAFREVLDVVGITGGSAANVVPHQAEVRINYRYGGHRRMDEAELALRLALEPAGGEVTVLSHSPAGLPPSDTSWAASLMSAGAGAVRAKQAWTPVAECGLFNMPALNFGPGEGRYAHTADEQVSVDALVHSYRVLARFLGERPTAPAVDKMR